MPSLHADEKRYSRFNNGQWRKPRHLMPLKKNDIWWANKVKSNICITDRTMCTKHWIIIYLPFSSLTKEGKQKLRSSSLASWQSIGSKALGKKTRGWSSGIPMQASWSSSVTWRELGYINGISDKLTNCCSEGVFFIEFHRSRLEMILHQNWMVRINCR